MRNIVVIGLGALGRRHLQSLLELKGDFSFHGVEVNADAMPGLVKDFPNVELLDDISLLPEEIELCVISTSSNARRSVFDDLFDHCKVKNIIFEKVLFQRISDYYHVKQRLDENGCKAWVNCVRREWDSYQLVKQMIKDEKTFTMTVTGGEWGLCCNGIHMIDLVQFLADDSEFTLDRSAFLSGIVESKRAGFKEMFGTIAGTCGKCSFFQISCMRGNDNPSLIMINSDNQNIIIDETFRKIYSSTRDDEWRWEEKTFDIEYVSQTTVKIADSILKNGNCKLVDYNQSMESHVKYINMWLDEFHKQGMEGDLCPIT